MFGRQRAFSLLELLLVLVCMAVIVSWAMHHYQVRVRRAQTVQVESDIKSLQRALDIYFHQTGCDSSGNFPADLVSKNICSNLEAVVCNRPPLVAQYLAIIVKTGQSTQSVPPKPLYQLQVQAVMKANLTPDQLTWYQQQLAAEENPTNDGTLVWTSLPGNSYVQLGDGSWVLNGSAMLFRATENQRSPASPPPALSGSFCAD